MKRFLITCSYDGSDFAGWQKQNNKRCVQTEIEKAVACFDQGSFLVVGCSRTDAKVHARGQRFHYDTDLKMNGSQVVKAINTHLPKDVFIMEAKEVGLDFHARYHANNKCYKYLINNKEYDVLTRNYQTYIKDKLDVAKMREAAKLFIGKQDFTTFCATTLKEKENQVREVRSIDISEDNGLITLTYEGKGFLRYMVRMMTQTLIEVGRGKIDKNDVERMLKAKDKRACRYNARPEGLYLVRIDYD